MPDTKEAKPLDPIKWEEQVFVVIDQTEKKRFVETFSSALQAHTFASERAVRLGRPVAVFGPQLAVKVPPAPRQEADELDLNWLAKEAQTNDSR